MGRRVHICETLDLVALIKQTQLENIRVICSHDSVQIYIIISVWAASLIATNAS